MDKINLTRGGQPLSCDTINFLQDAVRASFTSIVQALGIPKASGSSFSGAILWGCAVNPDNTAIAPGAVAINGEVYDVPAQTGLTNVPELYFVTQSVAAGSESLESGSARPVRITQNAVLKSSPSGHVNGYLRYKDAPRIDALIRSRVLTSGAVTGQAIADGTIPAAKMDSDFLAHLRAELLKPSVYYSDLTASTETPSSAGRNMFAGISASDVVLDGYRSITYAASQLGQTLNAKTVTATLMGGEAPKSIYINTAGDGTFDGITVKALDSDRANLRLRVSGLAKNIGI